MGFCLAATFNDPVGSSGSVFGGATTGQFGSYSGVGGMQYYSPGFGNYYSNEQMSTYWPILNNLENDQCEATTDFMIMIPPGGCTPMVVRSDLLEEQNVPVFCQLEAIQINPLIKVASIKSISFKGNYSASIAGVSFHPARAALNTYKTLLGSPLVNNIGYVVIVLKRNKVEGKMEDWVSGNLIATITYDADQAYGTGKGEYYLPVLSDSDWANRANEFSFWNGKGYLKVRGISEGVARIDIMTDETNSYREMELKEGETSSLIYFPGFYCKAGLKIRLNKVVGPENQARLVIDGNEVWVREGTKILDDRCTVRSLAVLSDGTGSVDLSCPGERIILRLQKFGNTFSSDGNENNYVTGKQVGYGSFGSEQISGSSFNSVSSSSPVSSSSSTKPGNEENWFFVYSGNLSNNIKGDGGKEFALLASSAKEMQETELMAYAENLEKQFAVLKKSPREISLTELKNEIVKTGFFSGKKIMIMVKDVRYSLTETGKSNVEIIYKGINNVVKDKDYSSSDSSSAEPLVDEYFNLGNGVVDELVSAYSSEVSGNKQAFGEMALSEQIRIAGLIGKEKTMTNLIQKFLDTYPNSKMADTMRRKAIALKYLNFESAYKSVFINNKYHSIILDGLKSVSAGEKKTTISVGTQYFTDVEEGAKLEVAPNHYLIVDQIIPNSVKLVSYYSTRGNNQFDSSVYTINSMDSVSIQKRNVVVRKISVEEIAYVSVIPEIKNTQTEAPFSFRIGVEKRAIQIGPEKTQEMINNLNKTITEWQSRVDTLGKLVSGWKGACFATSSVLMIKSMMSGISGESMARSKVMAYYKQVCATDSRYSGLTATLCYDKLKGDIERDVGSYTKAINTVNGQFDGILKGNVKTEGLFGDQQVVDPTKHLENAKGIIGGTTPIKIATPDGEKEFKVSDATNLDQVRTAILWKQVESLPAGPVRDLAKKELDDAWQGVWMQKKSSENKKTITDVLGIKNVGEVVEGNPKAQTIYWAGGTLSADEAEKFTKLKSSRAVGITKDTVVQRLKYKDGKEYVLFFNKQDAKGLQLIEAISVDKMLSVDDKTFADIQKSYSFVSAGACANPFKSGQNKVKYYESGANKGKPAIVPFDLKAGWYVKIPGSAGTVLDSSPKTYQANGDVSYFLICNVGTNGIEENGAGDDFCQSFDVNTYNKVDRFLSCPAMSAAKVQELAVMARQAVKEAQTQYGNSVISILGQSMGMGTPMSDTGDYQCQDFMSVDDCKLMFNVCDPVICPSSRCNLGGKYTVSDVVQTGIIGSIMLCLPNFNEGIYVPVCLTGIHAGLDGYVQLLKDHQKCLQQSLATGEHVGICDQITSIYMCEFFWRQFAPLMDLLLPKFVELAYGGFQGARGGGEYLTVQASWDNLQKSVEYFKNNYAQNAFRAFQYRSIQEAGGDICKAFVGTSVPSSASILDSLLAPESPTQFAAWFSEISFTDATLPPTSQYKVYFRIYAGNDKSVRFRVYLKDPPASGYYKNTPTIEVKTGFIAKGESVDQSLDFTAPQGYKQLCVVTDAEEHCGFKQVSTDFGLQLISSKYVADQANKTTITKEKECISGTPSVLGLASNPNLQAGVEQAITPSIAQNGIVRVCATYNPENMDNTANSPRWKPVGYCDNPQVVCWLDIKSVEKDLKLIQAVENTTLSVMQDQYANSANSVAMNYEQVQAELRVLEKDIGDIKLSKSILEKESSSARAIIITNQVGGIVDRLDKIIKLGLGGGPTTNDQARALMMKARVYDIVVESLSWVEVIVPTPARVAEKKTEDAVVSNTNPDSSSSGTSTTSSVVSLSSISVGDLLVSDGGESFIVRTSQPIAGEWALSIESNRNPGTRRVVRAAPLTDIKTLGYSLGSSVTV
ncbi:MAG: hypothetical protein WCP89_00445 [archaeon]